ncbi:MAG TPA: Clp protease N-terminal domain-containing protein [Bryobacteraceae bacterium]
MFERYTEKARRVIFFARYEASQRGMPEIDTPCLLLGILRDDKDLMARLLASGSGELAGIVPAGPKELARLSSDVEALFPKTDQEIATNVDLPVSHQATFALACAAEEAVGLGHKSIDPRHLLLGLLRANGPEAACLKAHGIGPEKVRADFVHGGKIDAPGAPPQPALAPEWARRYMELVRVLQSMPADRRDAAATLLEGLASGKFEVTGISRNGPFHFSFGDKAE